MKLFILQIDTANLNSANLLPHHLLHGGLYSTAQCKFQDCWLESMLHLGQVDPHICHLGHFPGSHKSTGLNKNLQMTQFTKVKIAAYEEKSTNNLVCAS